MGKRTARLLAEEAATELAYHFVFRSTNNGLKTYTVYISAVQRRGQRTPVTMAQPRTLERIR